MVLPQSVPTQPLSFAAPSLCIEHPGVKLGAQKLCMPAQRLRQAARQQCIPARPEYLRAQPLCM